MALISRSQHEAFECFENDVLMMAEIDEMSGSSDDKTPVERLQVAMLRRAVTDALADREDQHVMVRNDQLEAVDWLLGKDEELLTYSLRASSCFDTCGINRDALIEKLDLKRRREQVERRLFRRDADRAIRRIECATMNSRQRQPRRSSRSSDGKKLQATG